MSQSLPHFQVARAGAAQRESEADPDLELVQRWQGGDAGAFELLVRRHQQRVFGLLMRMLGDRDEALDAAQETFLNLHRHGHRFRREARWSTFVYRVAVNAALNRRRNLGRRRAHLEALSQQEAVGALPGAPASPEAAALSGELRARVQAEILALPPALRAPVILYDIEGLPYAEIAATLNIAEGTVKSRIHRARQTLRKRLAGLMRESSELDGGASESAGEASSAANARADSTHSGNASTASGSARADSTHSGSDSGGARGSGAASGRGSTASGARGTPSAVAAAGKGGAP